MGLYMRNALFFWIPQLADCQPIFRPVSASAHPARSTSRPTSRTRSTRWRRNRRENQSQVLTLGSGSAGPRIGSLRWNLGEENAEQERPKSRARKPGDRDHHSRFSLNIMKLSWNSDGGFSFDGSGKPSMEGVMKN